MSFCIGIALVMQIVSVNAKPRLYFRSPQMEITRDCDHLTVSKASRYVSQNNLHWDKTPNILVCASSNATLSRVKKAANFWAKLGYDFGSITQAETANYSCAIGTPLNNQILIDIPSQDFSFGDHLGTTKTWWRTDTGEILKAKIEILPGWENTERILEHEIGHALGWTDNHITGHIMNRSWSMGGHGTRGVRKKP